MASRVSTKNLPADTNYEPGFYYYQAITDEHAETKDGAYVLVVFPPHSKSRAHYHKNADVAVCCVSGKSIFLVGEQKKEFVIEPDDFLYIPRGEIHNFINPSDTETAVCVVAYFGLGCSSPYKSGKVIVE